MLGDNVQGLIDTYQLLNDPDLAGDQRMISLEDGAFRNVYILTDNLTRKLDSSVAQSIRADRLMLLGLVTGSTTQDEWRQALGEPTRQYRYPRNPRNCGAYARADGLLCVVEQCDAVSARG